MYMIPISPCKRLTSFRTPEPVGIRMLVDRHHQIMRIPPGLSLSVDLAQVEPLDADLAALYSALCCRERMSF